MYKKGETRKTAGDCRQVTEEGGRQGDYVQGERGKIRPITDEDETTKNLRDGRSHLAVELGEVLVRLGLESVDDERVKDGRVVGWVFPKKLDRQLEVSRSKDEFKF